MEFVFTGFNQKDTTRLYAFQRVDTDRSRTDYAVTTDVTLAFKHKIPLQDLPLLCRALLEGKEPSPPGTVIFTEKDMLAFVHRRSAERDEVLRKKAHHRPFGRKIAK